MGELARALVPSFADRLRMYGTRDRRAQRREAPSDDSSAIHGVVGRRREPAIRDEIVQNGTRAEVGDFARAG